MVYSWRSLLNERCTQMMHATTMSAIGGKIIKPLLTYP